MPLSAALLLRASSMWAWFPLPFSWSKEPLTALPVLRSRRPGLLLLPGSASQPPIGGRCSAALPHGSTSISCEEVFTPGAGNSCATSCVTITVDPLVLLLFLLSLLSGGGALTVTAPVYHPGIVVGGFAVFAGVHVTPPKGDGLTFLTSCSGRDWGWV